MEHLLQGFNGVDAPEEMVCSRAT